MKDRKNRKNSIFSFKRYIVIFFAIAFIVAANFALFLHTLDLSEQVLRENAPWTFGNILFISFLCCMFDGIQRKFMIERPVKKILHATEQLSKGDFQIRIRQRAFVGRRNEFDEIAENINTLAEELNGIETLRSDFVSNVSHELKTPLAVISNYATMLQKEELRTQQRLNYAGAIRNATQDLSELISNILKLNKLENQQIFPEVERYDLSEQICECMLHFEEIWEKKHIEVEAELAEAVMICKDRELLSIVWNNLLSNAFKFTESGGMVRVELNEENGYAIVKIKDSGCGISPKEGKHIFDKFYQGDTSHATKGNGLGLALVKRVIDISDMDISVASEVGKGTTFGVKIKLGE